MHLHLELNMGAGFAEIIKYYGWGAAYYLRAAGPLFADTVAFDFAG